MAQMISPGVYTNIIDLSEYLESTPGTIGFVPILTEQGPDNILQRISSREQYFELFGEPNIGLFGKHYGQGPYIATKHLSVSSDLFVLRSLPDDATYAHAFLCFANLPVDPDDPSNTDTHVGLTTFNVSSTAGLGSMESTQKLDSIFYTSDVAELKALVPSIYAPDGSPDTENKSVLMYLRAVGRGDYYNKFSVKIEASSENEQFGVYSFQLFAKDSDGSNVLAESYFVSFNPESTDSSGDSMFIEDVINRYSKRIVCKVSHDGLERMQSLMLDFYRNDPTLPDSVISTYINTEDDSYGYRYTKILEAKSAYELAVTAENEAYDALAVARALPLTDTGRDAAISSAITALNAARADLELKRELYNVSKNLHLMTMVDYAPGESMAGLQSYPFGAGSLGSLVTVSASGVMKVQAAIADQVLCDAYLGLLKKPVVVEKVDPVNDTRVYKQVYCDEVMDLDWIYFSIVYDAGYRPDVKQAALELADTYRRDCVLISDCGDNMDVDDVEQYVGAVEGAADARSWNSYLAARYEPYNRVYDVFTGRDIWVSPVYHMAKIIPETDLLYAVWYAAAGYNRGTAEDIKELRWSANKSQRDRLYLARVNPIVYFPEGMTVWGQLTTQKRATALSDLNVVRMVLYVKRALEQYLKFYPFDFNDQPTWDAITLGCNDFLDRVQSARGLISYNVSVGATEYELKSKICHVNVTLKPNKIIEKIELNLFITN